MCCSVEHAGDQKLYWAIARWLDGSTTVEKPALLTARGQLTIVDVSTPESEAEYPDLVRRWAEDVWSAYASQHQLARAWLGQVRARMEGSGSQQKR